MQKHLFILAAIALFGQFNYAVAQSAATQGQTHDQFFTTIVSSSVAHKPSPDQAVIKRCCEKIERDIQRIYFLQNRNGRMKMQIKGVYAHGTSIFFWLQLNNRSLLDYEVDSIRFLIAAAGDSKGPAAPLKALEPLYVYDSASLVAGHGRAVSVFVLPRFTLSAGQRLLVYVREKNGGRALQVRATNWTLERARQI